MKLSANHMFIKLWYYCVFYSDMSENLLVETKSSGQSTTAEEEMFQSHFYMAILGKGDENGRRSFRI
jgi:hypothetical protein